MQAVSLHTVSVIHGRHTGFVLSIPCLSRSGTTLLLLLSRERLWLQAPRVLGWDPEWVGMRGMQVRVRGGRECHKLNEEIESEEWLTWTSAHHDHSSILRRAEGLMLLRHQHPLVKKTRQQQHSSDLSLCTLRRCGPVGHIGHILYFHCDEGKSSARLTNHLKNN